MDEEIIICKTCKGRGVVDRSEITDYHHNYYDEWTEKCDDCGGSGRILKTSIIRYERYIPKKPKPRKNNS